jgi:hypothetical protein
MRSGKGLRRLGGVAATLAGVLFFFSIVGVFGLQLAIAGLAVFIVGAVVIYLAFPVEGADL